MLISPISLDSASPAYDTWLAKNEPFHRRRSSAEETVFNQKGANDILDALLYTNEAAVTSPTGDILGVINTPQLQVSLEEHDQAGFLQMMFLQYPNKVVGELVHSIVSESDSNDVKAHKLQLWVAQHIHYRLDSDVYRMEEVWQPPVITIQKGTGDCEDQALLLHSLMLNAGIPAKRIRTYGGYVNDGEGTRGGHAWTAYQRESDNEWVILDTTFYPDLSPVSSLALMKDSEMYKDDYFFITLSETVYTTVTDRIHNPDILPVYGKTGVLQYDTQRAPGMWLSTFA